MLFSKFNLHIQSMGNVSHNDRIELAITLRSQAQSNFADYPSDPEKGRNSQSILLRKKSKLRALTNWNKVLEVVLLLTERLGERDYFSNDLRAHNVVVECEWLREPRLQGEETGKAGRRVRGNRATKTSMRQPNSIHMYQNKTSKHRQASMESTITIRIHRQKGRART
jgi:hypothetical protein